MLAHTYIFTTAYISIQYFELRNWFTPLEGKKNLKISKHLLFIFRWIDYEIDSWNKCVNWFRIWFFYWFMAVLIAAAAALEAKVLKVLNRYLLISNLLGLPNAAKNALNCLDFVYPPIFTFQLKIDWCWVGWCLHNHQRQNGSKSTGIISSRSICTCFRLYFYYITALILYSLQVPVCLEYKKSPI